MAVVTVKSAQITNRDASPVVLTNGRIVRGEVKHARGVVAIANGDSIASKYLVCSIPSNAIPISARVTSPDIGTTTAADVGLYQTTANGGAVADVDFFGSAVSLSGGALAKSDITNENGAVATPANGEKPVWELLGLTADSGRDYDVVLTLTAAADAAGSVLLEIDYAI
jgi:hypothetical protein